MSIRSAVRPRAAAVNVAGTGVAGAAIASLLAIFAWTLLVNWPLLAREDADDGFFVEVGRLWAHGQFPYLHAFDIKAPGAFAAIALACALFGASLSTLKFLALAASAVAAALLARLAAQRDRKTAFLVAILYPPLSLVSGDIVYQLMNMALIGAFTMALSRGSGRARAIGAGLAVGCACTTKQTAALDLVIIGCAGFGTGGANGLRDLPAQGLRQSLNRA
jgi:hypothetical protein